MALALHEGTTFNKIPFNLFFDNKFLSSPPSSSDQSPSLGVVQGGQPEYEDLEAVARDHCRLRFVN